MSHPRRVRDLLRVLALGALIAMPSVGLSQGDKPWGPYLKDKKGETKPLPEKIERMKDEDWMKVAYTDYSGIKPRLAVHIAQKADDDVSPGELKSDVGKLIWMFSKKDQKLPHGMEHPEIHLRQALGATNRFRMVEGSSSADNILDEQDFGESGRVSGASKARLKRISGAQYLARVTILEIDPEKEAKEIKAVGGGLTGSTLGIASVGVKGTVAFAYLNAKIVNVETGDIVCDITTTGTSKGKGSSFGGGLLKGVTGGLVGGGAGISSESAASLTEAIQACVNKIAYLAAGKVEDLPLTLDVVDADAKGLTVEGGRDLGLQVGMLLRLESKGDPITNAEGEVLDYKRTDNGKVKVVRVLPTVSQCEYVEGGTGTKKGDLATFEPKGGK